MGDIAKLGPKNEPSVVVVPEDPTLAMIERIATSPDANIDALEKLMGMRERAEDRSAEKQFNASMAACQKALKPITRRATNDHTRSPYAKLETIDAVARPIITDHGFSTSCHEFESSKTGFVGIVCDVTHSSGHMRQYRYQVPLDGAGSKGNSNMNAPQGWGSTNTYARRYAKCSVFDIQLTNDDDGNGPGNQAITERQAADLRELLDKTETDIAGFCDLYQIDKYADLPASKFSAALVAIGRSVQNKKGTKNV